MREILFRGKRKDNGEWVDGTPLYLIHERYKDSFTMIVPLNTEFGCGELDDFYEVIPETVGQFIGLTDKNDKRIFEGDILLVKRNESDGIYCVCYIDHSPTFGLCNNESPYYLDMFHSISSLYTVIGNIHDNPELLKGE